MCPEPARLLTILDIPFQVLSEKHLKQVLSFTALTSLRVNNFDPLKNDYSQHPCQWRCIRMMLVSGTEENADGASSSVEDYLDYANLGKLPLSKVKDIIIDNSMLTVQLPDPSKSERLSAVQRTTDMLKNAGQIRIAEWTTNRSAGFTKCLNCCLAPAEAELMMIAAIRVPPNKFVSLWDFCCRHHLLVMLMRERKTIKKVELTLDDAMDVAVFQALQQLQHLNSFTVLAPRSTAGDVDVAEELMQLCSLVCTIAEHLVVPTGRAVTVQTTLGMCMQLPLDGKGFEALEMDTAFVCNELNATLPESTVVEHITMIEHATDVDTAMWQLPIRPRAQRERCDAVASGPLVFSSSAFANHSCTHHGADVRYASGP